MFGDDDSGPPETRERADAETARTEAAEAQAEQAALHDPEDPDPAETDEERPFDLSAWTPEIRPGLQNVVSAALMTDDTWLQAPDDAAVVAFFPKIADLILETADAKVWGYDRPNFQADADGPTLERIAYEEAVWDRLRLGELAEAHEIGKWYEALVADHQATPDPAFEGLEYVLADGLVPNAGWPRPLFLLNGIVFEPPRDYDEAELVPVTLPSGEVVSVRRENIGLP